MTLNKQLPRTIVSASLSVQPSNTSVELVCRESVKQVSTTPLNSFKRGKSWQRPCMEIRHVKKLWISSNRKILSSEGRCTVKSQEQINKRRKQWTVEIEVKRSNQRLLSAKGKVFMNSSRYNVSTFSQGQTWCVKKRKKKQQICYWFSIPAPEAVWQISTVGTVIGGLRGCCVHEQTTSLLWSLRSCGLFFVFFFFFFSVNF